MIRFSSKATGDVQMLNTHGEALLRAIGKSVESRGVITPEQIPGALTALRGAIAHDAQQQAARDGEEPVVDDDDPDAKEKREDTISLGRRAFPLMQMLERAQEAGEPVLWGV